MIVEMPVDELTLFEKLLDGKSIHTFTQFVETIELSTYKILI